MKIYYEKLAHVVMEAGMAVIYPLQAGDPGKPEVKSSLKT